MQPHVIQSSSFLNLCTSGNSLMLKWIGLRASVDINTRVRSGIVSSLHDRSPRTIDQAALTPTPPLPHHVAAELLIVFWGVFFIAKHQEREPKLKARNFTKSINKGAEIVTRRRSLSVDSAASASQAEQVPQWDRAYGGNNPPYVPPAVPPREGATKAGGTAAAVGFRIMPPGNGAAAGASNDGDSEHGRRSVSTSLEHECLVFFFPARVCR